MHTPFQLHQRLQYDGIILGRFDLCQLLLMNDSQYPWFILVPQVANVSEIYQLSPTQRALLTEESAHLAHILAKGYHADKMNIAAIGNIVPQLHIHHIVRYQVDKAWPAPVWGKFPTEPYREQEKLATIEQVQQWLADNSAIPFHSTQHPNL